MTVWYRLLAAEPACALLKTALPGSTASTPVEIWLQDEAKDGQKSGHTYVWAEVGSRPPMRDNRHDSAYIFGAICPAHAVGAAIIAPAAPVQPPQSSQLKRPNLQP